MTALDDFIPRLPNQNWFTRRIGEGVQSKILLVSRRKDLVAKVYNPYYNYNNSILELARHEYDVAASLYRNAISVPHPEGVFSISSFWGKRQPGFVMERISGAIRLDELSNNNESLDYDLAQQLRDEEVEKTRQLGFIPADVKDRNCFYLPLERKIVLYDFLMWRAPDTPLDWEPPSLPLCFFLFS